jgi:plasmid stabilization system protein ParE
MNKSNIQLFWTQSAKEDLKEIYLSLKQYTSVRIAKQIRNEIYQAPSQIIFATQYQQDNYRLDCRRIILRNYKILYQVEADVIYIVRVFNTFQNPLKSLK